MATYPTLLKRLIEQLCAEDMNKRMNAAVELGRIGSLDAVNPLLNVLNDFEWVVQLAVIESLGELKDKRAEEPLLKLLDKENRKNVYGGENEKRWRIKMESVRALGKIGSRKAVGRLCQMVIGKDFYCVRTAAAEALGLIGDKKAIPFLKKLISKDTEINTEKFAKKSLLKLKYSR
jgi:HEAT repeat protein